jgi:hypothetical protein
MKAQIGIKGPNEKTPMAQKSNGGIVENYFSHPFFQKFAFLDYLLIYIDL